MTASAVIGPSPFGCSQTIVQLRHELTTLEFGDEDLLHVANAHALVTRVFAGQMRSSGRPFSCHTIGTASILAQNGGTIAEILAGILHATYEFGDAGAHVPGANPRRREELRAICGREAEEITHAFFRIDWRVLMGQGMDLRQFVSSLGSAERASLFVRVCNEIEQLADLPFSSRESRERCFARESCVVAMAEAIGRPDLSESYVEGVRMARNAVLPANNVTFPYLVPPASYSKRLTARLREFWHNHVAGRHA